MSTTVDAASTQDRRVYVGNLSYHIKWGQLKDFMRQGMVCEGNFQKAFANIHLAGNVVFADVLTTANGRSKGCGIVEYSTREEAQKAVQQLSNLELEGRQIYVREDREVEPKFNRNGPAPSNGGRPISSASSTGSAKGSQIFVNNLPFSVGWQELKDLFFQAGEVVRADVQQNHMGRSKGCGTVLFASANDAENAIAKFNGFELGGRNIEVREDRFANRAGFGFSFSNRGGRGGSFKSGSRFPPKQYSETKPNPFTDGAGGNGEPSVTIFVSNLPWATTDNDLVELFQTVGQVERAEIQLEASGRSAGAGVVKFDGPAAAESAILKFSGYEYGNRPLVLSFVSYPAAASVPAAVSVTPAAAPPAAVPAATPAAAPASAEPSV